MEHKVEVRYETNKALNKEDRLKNNLIMAGEMAGICYMPEDYLENGIEDEDKAIKRAMSVSKRGHYSVFEHSHITFIIHTNKMMCIILYSLNCYSASEKSGRYTMMKPESELESTYYTKWIGIFEKLISSYNKDNIYTVHDIRNLSMENARYMLSIFTPTVMAYTVPYNRAILTIEWLENIRDGFIAERDSDINTADPLELKARNNFYDKIIEGANSLAKEFKEQLGFKSDEKLIINDHKKIGIELFSSISFRYKTEGIPEDRNIMAKGINKYAKRSYYGDVYIDNYNCSYATLAQEIRHRTLHYQIFKFNGFNCCYIPKIIKHTPYENEWINDYNNLIKNGTISQCTLVDIIEEGRFEDWLLKAKERLCSRSQLEICDITRHQVEKFIFHNNNLCYQNKLLLENMVSTNIFERDNIKVLPRCKTCGYICKEPCKQCDDNVLYNRIV